jgi:diguanylate cyclase (GGDEF)-like protein
MHYTGMAAMRSRAMESYNPWLVALSMGAAMAFAWMSLAIAVRATTCIRCRMWARRLTAATLMGLGIAAMHYTAMAGAVFHDMGTEPSRTHTVQVGTLGACGIAALTVMVLAGTLAGAALDKRRLAGLGDAHAALEKAHQDLRAAHDLASAANAELEGAQDELLRTQASLCEMNLALSELSVRDGLTGVFNRRYFDRMLETEFKRAARAHAPIALLMLDVDYFKQLNDTQGHQQGDACLKQIAAMLLKMPLRDYDVVARYGGEEFVVLLPEAHPDGARQKAETIRERVLELALPNEASQAAGGLVSISVGLCVFLPKPGDDPQRLLKEADAALYRAKRAGRNRVEIGPLKDVAESFWEPAI